METKSCPCLIVTIDTESDNLWKQKDRITLENILQIPKLQELFNRYKIKPTYLVSYPVAQDKKCVSILRNIYEQGRCEIGSHLHAWTTPPVLRNEWDRCPYLYEFPLQTQRELLLNLTEVVRNNFDLSPVSYRAGRFGFDEDSVVLLEEFGYQIDTSVVPLMDFKDHAGEERGGPCFVNAPLWPYYLSKDNVCQPGESQILEIPVSVSFNRGLPEWGQRMYLQTRETNFCRRLLAKLNLLQIIWLYPTFFSVREMGSLCQYLLSKGLPVLNMMFHSSEILAGASPYHRTEKDVSAFLNKIEGIIRFLVEKKGVVSQTLSEFRENYIQRGGCIR